MHVVLVGFDGARGRVGRRAVRYRGRGTNSPPPLKRRRRIFFCPPCSLRPAPVPRRLPRSRLYRANAPPPTERRTAAAPNRRHRPARENPHRRDRRRAVPHAPTPDFAGRADLHPGKHLDRSDRLQARTLRRSRVETAGRDGSAVRRLPRSLGAIGRNRRSLPVLAGRTPLPIPARNPFPRPDRAANVGAADVGGCGATLSRRPPRNRGQATRS